MLLDVLADRITTLGLAAGSRSDAHPALSGETLAFVATPRARRDRGSYRIMTRDLGTRRVVHRFTIRLGTDEGSGVTDLATNDTAMAVASDKGLNAPEGQTLTLQTAPNRRPRDVDHEGSDSSSSLHSVTVGTHAVAWFVAGVNPDTGETFSFASYRALAGGDVDRNAFAGLGRHPGKAPPPLDVDSLVLDGAMLDVVGRDEAGRHGVYRVGSAATAGR